MLGSHKAVDYLAVVISGPPDYTEGKVIDVVEIDSSTGQAQAEAVWSVLGHCQAADNIRGFVFDTTASNTGCHQGAAQRLLLTFKEPKLWFECRHHSAELLAKSVWTELLGSE